MTNLDFVSIFTWVFTPELVQGMRDLRRGRENVHKRYLLHVTGHNLLLLRCQPIASGTPREAVTGGYGCIFVLKTPTGAVLVAQIVLIV